MKGLNAFKFQSLCSFVMPQDENWITWRQSSTRAWLQAPLVPKSVKERQSESAQTNAELKSASRTCRRI